MWEVPSGKLLSTPGGLTAGVSAVTFAPDGQTVVAGTADGDVLEWNPSTGATGAATRFLLPARIARFGEEADSGRITLSPGGVPARP